MGEQPMLESIIAGNMIRFGNIKLSIVPGQEGINPC
jgi:hypothetical protein